MATARYCWQGGRSTRHICSCASKFCPTACWATSLLPWVVCCRRQVARSSNWLKPCRRSASRLRLSNISASWAAWCCCSLDSNSRLRERQRQPQLPQQVPHEGAIGNVVVNVVRNRIPHLSTLLVQLR